MRDCREEEGDTLPGVVAWRTGHLLGSRYQLQEQVGGGSMGIIVRANDLHTGHAVAIKLMRAELRDQRDLQMRFIGEAMAMRRCEGPHCVALLDMGNCEELGSYIVMPYLQGDDFGNLLAFGYRPDVATCVRYLLQICEALQLAHSQGIVHCDIKPQNLFVTALSEAPSIQLLDFGIARCMKTTGIADSGSGNSDTEFESHLAPFLGAFEEGDVRGTPHYLAPEQLQGVPDLDARTDIWSLGAVLFELITGREAFSGDDLTQILKKVLRAQSPDPKDDFPGPLRQLHAIILRCLSYNPAHRYASVQELSQALQPFACAQTAGLALPPLPAAVRRLRHSTTERLSREIIARSMAHSLASDKSASAGALAVVTDPSNASAGARAAGARAAVSTFAGSRFAASTFARANFAFSVFSRFPSFERKLSQHNLPWGKLSWTKAAVAAGFLAAGVLGAFLGFRYLQWPRTKQAAPMAAQGVRIGSDLRADPDKANVLVRVRTVRAAQAERARAPRISVLPAGYRRNNRDRVTSPNKRR